MDLSSSDVSYSPPTPKRKRKSDLDKSQDELERLKGVVKNTYDYFKPNYDRFNEFRTFVFKSSMTDDEQSLLVEKSVPPLQFNVLESKISRLLGEFSKQEPSIEVSADNDRQVDPNVIKLVDYHLRHLLGDSNNKHTNYEVYKDVLSGGFSTIKLYTDYQNPMSMHQDIMYERAFDPTMCGFDKTARYSHKGDGRFCFELFPKTKEETESENLDVNFEDMGCGGMAGFNWAYMNDDQKIALVCEYFEKKKKPVKILRLSNNQMMTEESYEKMLKSWSSITQPPRPLGKTRKSEIDVICRYRFVQNQVLEYIETDYTIFPLIFVDGSSIMIKASKEGNVEQFTRPYVYHARDAQKLKNYAGSSWANYLENIVQHKFMVKREAIPKEPDYRAALFDVQTPSVIVTNAFYQNDPDKPIVDGIREVQHTPMPPEISQAFMEMDRLIETSLGSFDSALGINDNQLSGIAIIESATQSNAAAMPFIVGVLQGLQRVAEGYVGLMPKYYSTPRTIPIMDPEGKRDYVKINQEGGIQIDFEDNALNVKVEAGVNFQIQKSRALMQLEGLMKASPQFAQFMNEKGLKILLDNLEIRGIDEIKIMAEDWIQEVAKQKQMMMEAQQKEMQNNPAVLKAKNEQMKLQLDAQKAQLDAQKSQSQLQMDLVKLHHAEQKVEADIEIEHSKSAVQILKSETERFSKETDLKIKHADMAHRHMKEATELQMAHTDMKHRHTQEKKAKPAKTK